MADPLDPNPGGDPLKSEDNYQNLGGLPNFDQNGAPPPPGGVPPPPGGAPPPPPPTGQPPTATATGSSHSNPTGDPSTTPSSMKGGEPGDGVLEIHDADPSEKKKKKKDVNKPKIKKLKKKMKRVKMIFWIATILWLILLAFFIVLHLNHYGVHLLPIF